MPDKLISDQHHKNMSRIRAKDTKPEIIVRKFLWSHGFRYRLNHPRLPGKPDIVLRKYRTCIFVNGCFWHGHRSLTPSPFNSLYSPLRLPWNWGEQPTRRGEQGIPEIMDSECCKIPRTNREFWVRKILRNQERDREVQQKLAKMGWHCITVWECSLTPALSKREGEKSKREQTLENLAYTLNHIYLLDHSVHKPMKYELPQQEIGMAAEDRI